MATTYELVDAFDVVLVTRSSRAAAELLFADTPAAALLRTAKGTVIRTREAEKPTDEDKAAKRKAAAKAYRRKLMDRDPDAVAYPDTKECRRCREVQPRDSFLRDLSINDGLRQWCRSCLVEHARNKRQAKKAGVTNNTKEK
jgi:hypothetical protein